MSLLGSKKGDDSVSMSLEVLIRLIVVFGFIFIPVMAFILTYASSDYFERNYLAMDLSLVTDAVYSSPNNLIYNYPKDTRDYSIELKENTLVISKKGMLGNMENQGVSYFIGSPLVKLEQKEISPIIEDIKDSKSAIPIKLIIERRGSKINYYNDREELLKRT